LERNSELLKNTPDAAYSSRKDNGPNLPAANLVSVCACEVGQWGEISLRRRREKFNFHSASFAGGHNYQGGWQL